MSEQRIAELEAENARLRERIGIAECERDDALDDRYAAAEAWEATAGLVARERDLRHSQLRRAEHERDEASVAARAFAEAGELVATEARGLVDAQDDKAGRFLIRALVDVIEAAEAWDAALATSPGWLPETESNA